MYIIVYVLWWRLHLQSGCAALIHLREVQFRARRCLWLGRTATARCRDFPARSRRHPWHVCWHWRVAGKESPRRWRLISCQANRSEWRRRTQSVAEPVDVRSVALFWSLMIETWLMASGRASSQILHTVYSLRTTFNDKQTAHFLLSANLSVIQR